CLHPLPAESVPATFGGQHGGRGGAHGGRGEPVDELAQLLGHRVAAVALQEGDSLVDGHSYRLAAGEDQVDAGADGGLDVRFGEPAAGVGEVHHDVPLLEIQPQVAQDVQLFAQPTDPGHVEAG